MNAKEMFEELGFNYNQFSFGKCKETIDTKKIIVWKNEPFIEYRTIENVVVDKTDYEQKIVFTYLLNNKETELIDINIINKNSNLIKAIYQQCKELGWLDKEDYQ